MTKNTGLGKGLSALFTEEEVKGEEIAKEIKITEVEPNKNQPRKKFDQEALNELADSIRQYGVLQPIIVSKKENYYEIIAGERRWRASKLAGLFTIPAIIREDDEKKNKEIALIENIQREDLNPIEKAKGIKQLMDDYDLTQQEAAEIIGRSRSGIANTVRLLNLDERVQDMLLQGNLTEGHAKILLGEENKEKQYQMALAIVKGEDSVRELENKIGNKKLLKEKDERYEAIFKDIENSFQDFFGTKVKLNAKAKSGKIVIEYSSNEELERILGLVK